MINSDWLKSCWLTILLADEKMFIHIIRDSDLVNFLRVYDLVNFLRVSDLVNFSSLGGGGTYIQQLSKTCDGLPKLVKILRFMFYYINLGNLDAKSENYHINKDTFIK